MRKLLMGTAIALVLGVSSHAHAGEMHTVAASGLWTAARGTGNDNQPMCSAYTYGPDYAFFVKATNKYGLYFQVGREGWNIAGNQPVMVNMWVDNAQAEGWHLNMHSNASVDTWNVYGLIRADDKRDDGKLWFVHITEMLIAGQTLHIQFPNGNTGQWNLNLTGSADVMRAFWGCIAEEAHVPNRNVGQPYGGTNNNVGQPYGTAPAKPTPSPVTPKYYYEG
jgi:hypothetical protein